MWSKQAVLKTVYGDGACGDVFQGDARELGGALKAYEGRAATVYLDPPYLTGSRFTCRVGVGKAGALHGRPHVTLPAYGDQFESRDSYLSMLALLCHAARDMLCNTGTLFLHLDWRMGAYAKVMLDELMGEDRFVNEIVWAYESGGRATRHFSRKHDVILMYRKTRKAYFDITQVPIDRKTSRHNHMRRQVDEMGRPYYTIKTNGKTYTYYEDAPAYPSDVWADVSHLQQKDPERTGYDTQKPLALLRRIIRPTSRERDLVADLCFGSGTTLLCAAKENRRFVGADASCAAVSTACKRLNGYGFTAHRPADMSPAFLDADFAAQSRSIRLRRFALAPLPDIVPADFAPGPLDLIDQWAAGVVRDGVFFARERYIRDRETPQTVPMLKLPEAAGTPAVEIIDALLRRHVYILTNA